MHHEREDGSGYPLRLKGEEIPFEVKVLAVADVFEALTANRPYREAYSFSGDVDRTVSVSELFKVFPELDGSHQV